MPYDRAKIKAAIAREGITQAEAARRARMRPQDLNSILSGSRPNVTISLLDRIAEAVECDTADLLIPRKIDSLEQEIREVHKKVDAISSQPFTVYLTDLSDSMKLRRDVPVLIQSTGDDFVATFVDAGISASGDTEVEAASNLKDIIIQKYNILGSTPEGKLGIIPRQQFAALKKLIKLEG